MDSCPPVVPFPVTPECMNKEISNHLPYSTQRLQLDTTSKTFMKLNLPSCLCHHDCHKAEAQEYLHMAVIALYRSTNN